MTSPLHRALVVGDPYFDCEAFRVELRQLEGDIDLDYLQIDSTSIPVPRTESEARLREYVGDPRAIAAALPGHDILVVHGAGVSDEVLSTPGLALVCCARGGPVNIDVPAATALGIPVCTTPGKNAEAVAELTIAFALMLLRGVLPARDDLAGGRAPMASAFDGAQYFGAEAASTNLGLVGYGSVGRQVAWRARALGFAVHAYDPYSPTQTDDPTRMVSFDELLSRSDIVSLHARLTDGTRHLMNSTAFDLLRPGASFINTAREQLVNESALVTALNTGRVAAAALDVVEFGDGRNPLLDMPKVVVTPHIGGATSETLLRGARMAKVAIRALLAGQPLPHLVNPPVDERQTVTHASETAS